MNGKSPATAPLASWRCRRSSGNNNERGGESQTNDGVMTRPPQGLESCPRSQKEMEMANCVQCGSQIPEGQRVCSMCYGDIDYGNDGYYREWAEQEDDRETENDRD